jgi:heat shock protein HslJ
MPTDGAAAQARGRWWLLVPALLAIAVLAAAAETGFPFDQELLLDTAPLPDSKRVPSLEVGEDGAAVIDLWCASGQGRVTVDGPSISIVPHAMEPAVCPPERSQLDAGMLSALTQITTWRREGDAVVLIGPQVLRYRVSSH